MNIDKYFNIPPNTTAYLLLKTPHVSLLTDHHQAVNTIFKNKAKNAVHMDSLYMIIKVWDPTSRFVADST